MNVANGPEAASRANGVEAISSHFLEPLRHGFFARCGGVSNGLYESLNCGPGSADNPESVNANRARVAAWLGVDDNRLLTLRQVHSNLAVTVDEASVPGLRENVPRADAIATATPGLALGVLSADCQPVLFADREAGVIAAAHAGWRGAISGVLEAALDAMESLGARREATDAAIGPAISQRAYEVGPDMLDEVLAEDSDAERFFAGGEGDRAKFDLPGYGLHRLRRAGVRDAHWTGHCTHSDSRKFFSYRRATQAGESDYGRQISVIVISEGHNR